MHIYRKKTILFLIAFLLIFLLIFLTAFINLQIGNSILHLGLGAHTENMILMFLASISIVRATYEIYKVEHPRDYEKRIKHGY